MSPGLHAGADADDAVLVEVLERLLAHVRDLARDLLDAALGVAHLELELLDVDRGEDVVLDEPLADQDGVLEVVAAPRHEGDQHVAPERELAVVGRRAVGETSPFFTFSPSVDDRPLVDAGVLVRAAELDQPVDVDVRRARE